MNGKLGRGLLVAILAVASWTAWRVDHRPALDTRSYCKSSFVDAHGDTHERITVQGEINPNETPEACLIRHAADFRALKKEFGQ